MKILITGSGGMVGTAVKQVLKGHDLICPKKYELNVANADQVMNYRARWIDFIVHLSCETDHEYCDINPAQCYFVNTIGTGNMVNLARAKDIPIIYVSTASVFDGKLATPYEIWNSPNPINHYNRSKYYGELITMAYSKHYILRAGWMFGGGKEIDKKFVNKIMKKVRDGQKKIMVADDCIGSPTYSFDLADQIKGIIEYDIFKYGTYHAVNECGQGVSRYEFGQAIVDILGLDVEIIPCKIDDLIEEFPCKRTNYEVLKGGLGMRKWKSALKGYLYANYKH